MTSSPYGWLMLLGILVTAVVWKRAAARDARLPLIYAAALVTAFLGAKVVYLLAEGWLDLGRADMWLRLATGKSILGGLLFGYAGVEWAKTRLGFRGATGDWFALVTPIGIGFGRVGCWLHGCCLGVRCGPGWYAVTDATGAPRWPSVPLELGFNAAALITVVILRSSGRVRGQLFHLYLMGYGAFRFAHEFLRDTPRVLGPLSGYHLAAAAVVGLGALGYRARSRSEKICSSQQPT